MSLTSSEVRYLGLKYEQLYPTIQNKIKNTKTFNTNK